MEQTLGPESEKTSQPVAMEPEVRLKLKQIDDAQLKTRQSVNGVVNLVDVSDLSGELAAKVEDFANRRTGLLEHTKEVFTPLMDCLQKAFRGEGEYGEVFMAADTCRMGKTQILENAIALSIEGGKLAAEISEELKPIAKAKAAERDETLAEIKAKLTDIGNGIESTAAGFSGTNAEAAERQFNILAKSNIHYRKVDAEAANLQNRVRHHVTLKSGSARLAETLRKQLVREVVSAVKV